MIKDPPQRRSPMLRVSAIGVALTTVIAGILVGASPAMAATTVLAPTGLTTTAGVVGSGQTYSALAVKDQTGTQDTWAKYVELSPSGSAAYSGYRTYALPSTVTPSSVTGISVAVNYKGPSTANQTWTWALYNWNTAAWTTVGTNATAPSWGSWKALTFASPTSTSGLVSSTGAIRVRVAANNTSDSANLDYEAVTVTSGTAPPADSTAPSVPAGLTVSGTPTSSSVSLAWAASTDNVGVTGYQVFQNGGTTPVATVTNTTATISGLAASTAFSFTIKARDAAGNSSAASSAVTATTAAGTTPPAGYTLPLANDQFDYQLGGIYTPSSGVDIVSRDRTAVPVAGKYNVCYVNLMQTQPDAPDESVTNPNYGTTQWWKNNHSNLLLKNSAGQVIVDVDWNEAIFDVRTAANRAALLEIQKPWILACKNAANGGFQAIEPDNLDSDLRSTGLITPAQNKEYLKLVIPYTHSVGLAIAQKNASDAYGTTGKTFVNTVSPAQGFDFAIAEECERYNECPAYSAYGNLLYEIEYTDENPNVTRNGVTKTVYQWACFDRGAIHSIILRDRDVVPSGTSGYVYQNC
ncbi:hypothetical protein EYE40_12285 [Glaciihabitans arcticus]|uniref:Fibronectin type-III domain-containing protein n=1 Tax=Glaciihabitans arcticus TaxID=2668039 RepID=A0A4Q9GXX7_9MICO|nr:endo alpha-1,4 polygalactosaminidase [Glaciihabitans arcticus]TBN58107.1 hypothetical protein EYE40_12285 [Glaciihabitans arcticus]